MKEADYQRCQDTALELVDWLDSKTQNSQEGLLILGRSFSLMAAHCKKPGVTDATMQKAIIEALKAEMKQAAGYYQKNPIKRRG